MSPEIACAIVLGVGVYLGLGLLFAIAFAVRGVGRIDPQAVSGTWGFRVLIVPGAAAFWPLLLARWWRGAPPPIERNPHRDAALSPPADERASSGETP